jgi:F0F1-type ATP synthase membrane subunit c/vacuolar-type H+-ATPase subunit K
MRSRVDLTPLLLNLLWAGMILAIAAFGAVVVRNVTDALVGIAYQQPSIVVVDRPSR